MTPSIIATTVLSLVALAGCGGSDDDGGDDGSDDAVEVSDDGAESGDGGASEVEGTPEFEAAVEKITATTDIGPGTAGCIVRNMVEDGTIGMGEVLTMEFADIASNADRLQEAYAAAVDNC